MHEYLWRKYTNKKAILEHLCDHDRIIPYQALIEPAQKLLVILQRCSQESLQLQPQGICLCQEELHSFPIKTDCLYFLPPNAASMLAACLTVQLQFNYCPATKQLPSIQKHMCIFLVGMDFSASSSSETASSATQTMLYEHGITDLQNSIQDTHKTWPA